MRIFGTTGQTKLWTVFFWIYSIQIFSFVKHTRQACIFSSYNHYKKKSSRPLMGNPHLALIILTRPTLALNGLPSLHSCSGHIYDCVGWPQKENLAWAHMGPNMFAGQYCSQASTVQCLLSISHYTVQSGNFSCINQRNEGSGMANIFQFTKTSAHAEGNIHN